jgi:hypothetical protein
MSTIQARQSIVTAIEAARASLGSPIIVEYDNRKAVDPANQHAPWLSVTVEVLDSYQGDLSNAPLHRHIGVILLAAYAKEGQGVVDSLTLLEHISTRIHRRQFGTVRTHLTDVRPNRRVAGWHVTTLAVPFWFDVVATIN